MKWLAWQDFRTGGFKVRGAIGTEGVECGEGISPGEGSVPTLQKIFVFFWFHLARFGAFWHVFEATRNGVSEPTFFIDTSNIHSNCNVVTLLLLLERCYFTS